MIRALPATLNMAQVLWVIFKIRQCECTRLMDERIHLKYQLPKKATKQNTIGERVFRERIEVCDAKRKEPLNLGRGLSCCNTSDRYPKT
jgi:hypothetical protein